MTHIVVDASIALAWCFPDEANQYADAVLVALEGRQILVPAIWVLEITNAISVAERRKRINLPEIRRFVELLEGLTINEDSLSISKSVNNILPLTQEYNLSAYDASYMAAAMRHGAPLATLDAKLKKAAGKAGVEILSVTQLRKTSI